VTVMDSLEVQQPKAKSKSDPRAFLVSNALAIVTVAGVVTYGILRVAYFQFYNNFGLKPEDVGLGYIEVLGQSVTGMIILLLLSSIFLVAFIVIFRIWVEVGQGFVALIKTRTGKITVLILLAVGGVVWAGLTYAPAMTKRVGEILLVTLLIIWIISLVFEGFRRLKRFVTRDSRATRLDGPGTPLDEDIESVQNEDTDRASGQRTELLPNENLLSDRFFTRALIAAAILAPFVVLLSLLWIGNVDANRVAQGRTVREVLFGVIPVVSWGAETATVTPIGNDVAKVFIDSMEECVMYLGQAHGYVIVVEPDRSASETHKIPEAEVLVTIIPQRTSCGSSDE
jgi:hypothetical protein